jgi:hypothetical protein
MNSCPRCGTGNFLSGRSLSVHMAQYCRAPFLLGNALISTQRKQSHGKLNDASCPRSSLQQAHDFNKLTTANVSVPTISTLCTMPSIRQLSSTPSELANSSVRYSGFDFEPSDESEGVNLLEEPINSEKPSFVRNKICLPPDIAFQVHCLYQISTHRGNNLNMFNQIMQCVKMHAVHHKVDFTTLNVMSREQLVKYLCKYYKLDFLKPTLHIVQLSDNSTATIPIFDVKAKLLSFLNDPSKMHNDNFAADYDIFTGKSTSHNPPLDEIYTGSLWEEARSRYCGDDPSAFLLGLVCFYDKTNTNVFGLLACSPFICTPCFLNRDCRNDDSNYIVLGYIPNLGFGKGTATQQTSTMKLQDEHNCLALITNQIKQIHNEGGF